MKQTDHAADKEVFGRRDEKGNWKPVLAARARKTVYVVKTLTANLNIGLHANQPHADNRWWSKTI